MKKYVFTVKDDVCAANGKDVNATELLAKMKLYGEVVDYDKAMAAERTEWQKVVDSLKDQLTAAQAYAVTNGEMAILAAIREFVAKFGAEYESRIGALEGQLDDIRVEEQNRAEQIMALLTKR